MTALETRLARRMPVRGGVAARTSRRGPPAGARRRRHAHVRFWVRDNGPGLAPEEQARLFPSSSDSAMATVPEEGEGRSSRWNTLRALRVLDWYSARVQRRCRWKETGNYWCSFPSRRWRYYQPRRHREPCWLIVPPTTKMPCSAGSTPSATAAPAVAGRCRPTSTARRCWLRRAMWPRWTTICVLPVGLASSFASSRRFP
jgi:hypothetical protein